MKSAKHVKMNRTSLVSPANRRNRNAVKSEFWEKNVPYTMLSCLLPYFLTLKKKFGF